MGATVVPLYDVKCQACGTVEEILTGMFQDPPACSCGGQRTRLPSWRGGMILKGSDWPSRDISRAKEDRLIGQKAKTARYLKASGQVPVDTTLSLKDVDVDRPLKAP